MNWFAVTIISIWFSSAIGTIFSKDPDCLAIALIITLIMGIGYLIYKVIL